MWKFFICRKLFEFSKQKHPFSSQIFCFKKIETLNSGLFPGFLFDTFLAGLFLFKANIRQFCYTYLSVCFMLSVGLF